MPVFHYRALDGNGAVVRGTLDCPNEATVVRQLQSEGHVPVEVSLTPSLTFRDVMNFEITPRSALSARDRMAFTRALATLLGAKLPLDRALQTLSDLGATPSICRVSASLLEDVRAGSSLSRALDSMGTAFPQIYRGILRAGEASTHLDVALEELADMLEENARRSGDLRSAMIYPAFLVVTAIGAVAILLTFVVPTFQPLLTDAGVELPLITRVVIAAGDFAAAYGKFVLAGVAIAVLLLLVALRTSGFRKIWHRMILRLPLLGPALLKNETSLMAGVLATMLANGVTLPSGLRMVVNAIQNRALAAEIERVIPDVEAGRGFAIPLQENALLPPLALQMIRIGEESGDLTPMLRKLSKIFGFEAKRAFDQMIAVLTPLLTLVMGVIVALIVSSILYALFSINALAI